MRRVLFIDDDTNILHGLRRMLRSMGHHWEMEFESIGPAALEAIRVKPFDIVVSDMKMPGMDGADLLSEVKRLHPETVRIILSGHSEKEAILKCIGSTHQYLSKPCNAETLKDTLQRIDNLQALLGNASIKRSISQMNSLPSLPTLFQQVVDELHRPDASLELIGEVIAQDIGMSAKILQLVNSSYFGLSRPTTNVAHAVTQLGLETINSLVLNDSVFSQHEGTSVPGFAAESLWNHSILTAAFARALAQTEELDRKTTEDAYMAGLLHDAGKLILTAHAPGRYGQVLQRVSREGRSLCEVEKDVLDATHAEVGAYVLGLWGLPDSIVEAIAYHARPLESPLEEFGVLTIVHAASGLEREFDATGDTAPAASVDLEYLTNLGLEARLPVWREVCRKVLVGDDR